MPLKTTPFDSSKFMIILYMVIVVLFWFIMIYIDKGGVNVSN